MHHNNLKYGDIDDDFCYIPKSFCTMKEGGGGANFGPLVQNFRIWAEMKSFGHYISKMDSMTPKTPDNMYHT